MTRTLMLLALMVGTACKDDTPVDSGDTQPTGTDSDVTDDTSVGDDSAVEECLTTPSELSPEEDETGWFYRDPIMVRFSEPVTEATFRLYNGQSDEEHSVTVSWNESNEVATLTADGYLHPSWSYKLDITVCERTYTTAFETSDYGQPLDIPEEELVSSTYVVEFGEVEFTEPEGFGALLALYVDVPVLIGVMNLEGGMIDLLGAQGRVTSQGEYVQRLRADGVDVPTWPFSGVDFSDAPFFEADADSITLDYDGVEIPVFEFHIEGTFAADGQSFAGGKLWGLGDTRHMGGFFNEPDNPGYICNLVTSVGATCEPCPSDGGEYCLFIRGENIFAPLVPDLTLVEVAAN
ncbi:MAG: hypothetical protein H6741_31235 [Alphaproteobacteria bacterium]|nr:hypothetical protein [Alphaproteobacteria bacterium]